MIKNHNRLNNSVNQFKVKHFDELTTKELYEILKLRNEVFLREQKIEYNDLDDIDFDCLHVFLLDKDGKVIAYSRAIPSGKIGEYASFGRVCVRIDHRGKGLAKELIIKVIECIENYFKEKEILIGAQAYLEKFYASFGFVTISDIFDIGGIDHVKMIKKD